MKFIVGRVLVLNNPRRRRRRMWWRRRRLNVECMLSIPYILKRVTKKIEYTRANQLDAKDEMNDMSALTSTNPTSPSTRFIVRVALYPLPWFILVSNGPLPVLLRMPKSAPCVRVSRTVVPRSLYLKAKLDSCSR